MNISIERAAENLQNHLILNGVPFSSIGILNGKIMVVLDRDSPMKPNEYSGYSIEWEVLSEKSVKFLKK